MATIQERVEADLQIAREELAGVEAKVKALEAQVASIPEEIKQFDEAVWSRIKSLFGV